VPFRTYAKMVWLERRASSSCLRWGLAGAAATRMVPGGVALKSAVGDVVQLVRTLPRRSLESHTVTPDHSLGRIIYIYGLLHVSVRPSKRGSSFDFPKAFFLAATMKITNLGN